MLKKCFVMFGPLLHWLAFTGYLVLFLRQKAAIVEEIYNSPYQLESYPLGYFQLKGDPLHFNDWLLLGMLLIGAAIALAVAFLCFRIKFVNLFPLGAVAAFLIPLLPPFTSNMVTKLIICDLFVLSCSLLSLFLCKASVKPIRFEALRRVGLGE